MYIDNFNKLYPGEMDTILIQDGDKTRTVKVEVLAIVWRGMVDKVETKKYLMYSPSLGVCYVKGVIVWKTYTRIQEITYTLEEVLIPYNIPEMDVHLSCL